MEGSKVNLGCLALITLTAAVIGCGEPPAEPTPVKTLPEGRDPKIIGHWRTPDGTFEIDLKADGTSHIKASVMTPGGPQSTERTGTWGTVEERISFKQDDAGPDAPFEKYGYVLDSENLVLRRSSPPLDFFLERVTEE